ncbi:hypothetical protein [uncultured Dialister sp.]|uniref:hypothetical protein n=1 Tax=uncultured Dialister sp. TaxID=278064 RepID=UPI002592D791|nr:hypothetical protein [uncultured Dialister sp.]
MWHKRSNKLVLLAAMTAFLGGGIFPSMAKDGLTVSAGQTVSVTDGTSYKVFDDQNANGISLNGEDTGSMTARSTINIGDGKGTVHIKSESGDAGNSTANGVSVGPGGNLVVNGNVDISSVYSGSCFANGLAIVNGGSGEGTQAYLAVNGNVNIGNPSIFSSLTDESTDKNWGVNASEMHGGVGADGHTSAGSGDTNYSGARWHPTGISITANGHKSVIDLNGNVYAAIRGTALTVDPFYGDTGTSDYDLAVINANKGDVTILTPKSIKETYYAAASYGGSININSDGTNAAGHKVVMQGNVLAMRSNNNSGEPYFYQDGRVNIGLDTADSVWTGVVDNSGTKETGEVNLWLQNGAAWNHESMSKTNGIQVNNLPYPSSQHYGKYDKKTHIASLIGSTGDAMNGFIYQKESMPIYVNNYSGNVTLAYAHDNSNNIIGGDFYIANAAKGSSITVVTDRSNLPNGFDTSASSADWNTVSSIMSKLAQKLYYTANDGNLTGKVGIAEGLTASSALLRVGTMTFGTNGQGSYTGQDIPTIPSSQTDTSFTDTITGVKSSDQKYVNTGVLKDEGQHYEFTKDTTITAANTINVGSVGHAVDINTKGHTLTLDSETTGTGTISALSANSRDGVTITADKLVIKASDNGRMEAINVGGQGQQNKDHPNKLTINGDVDMQVNGSNYALGLYAAGNSEVTFNGNVSAKGDANNTWGLTSKKGAFGYYGVSLVYSGNNYALQMGPKVTINGDVNAKIDGNCLFANGGHAKLTINGGGNIEINKDNTHNYYAMIAESGTTSMNVNLDDNYNATGARTNKLVLKGNITASTGAVNVNEPELHSVVNLGLATKDSEWTGVAYNKFPEAGKVTSGKTFTGAINLFLQNGATWNNEEWGAVEKKAWGADAYTGSHITKLVGGDNAANAGVINQNDANDITVDNYNGNTKVIYKHDSTDPTKISGGSFRITNAAEGSAITLMTDRTGLTDGFSDNDSAKSINTVNEVLNKLAQKLFYTSYADKHLAGTVEIADGLTASSVSLKSGPISFSDGTTGTKTAGQGYYDYTPATEFTDTITGVRSADQKYVDTGVLKDDGQQYKFTTDTTITAANTINVGSVGHAVDINAKDHTLTLISATDSKRTVSALAANSQDGVTITADKLVIKASDNGRMEAINVGGQGQQNKDHPNKLTINGDVDMQVNGSNYALGLYAAGNSEVTFNGNVSAKGDANNTWGLTSKKGAFGYYGVSLVYSGNNYALQMGPKVTINGDVNAKIDGNCLFANGGHAKLTINGGGNIEINKDNTHNYYAMIAESGTTSMNVNLDDNYNATGARTNKLVLKGNITASTGAVNVNEPELHSVVNLGLATKDSEWTGVAYNKFPEAGKVTSGKTFTGAINLFLQNGATWNNEEWGAVETRAWGADPYTGSHITKLVGGDSAANAGVINQNDANDITVDNYSGSTMVIYKHEIVDDTARNNAGLYENKAASITGGSFKITNAEAGSAVTLVTDRTGLNLDSGVYTDKNLVNDTLDKLANKLIYTGYADKNLTGKVSIAEGLTAASVTKSLAGGDISWYDGSKEGTAAGEGDYDYHLAYPDSQTTDSYSEAITGDSSVDKGYVETGVLKDGTHDYSFTKPATTITVGKTLIGGGPWLPPISAAVSGGGNGQGKSHEANLDLHGNSMTIKTTTDTHTTGITAIGAGSVDVANAGKISVSAESTGGGQTAAIFVNGGGTVKIHNGGSNAADKVITLRAKGSNKYNVAVLKAMNGVRDAQSTVAIDGLVDILADGNDGSNEAVSAVASKVDIGGGNIKAVNGAVYAIRGYGEYQSSNKAIVNVNVKKDKDDHVTGAGTNDTAIEGDIFLGGGMDTSGARAEVNIGLNTKDSYFKGNIKKPNASSDGHVNLYMGNGASWIGNNLSGSTVTAHLNSDASWTGYSSGSAMYLDMNGTGLWNNAGDSSIASISGNGGLINMSGDKAGTVSVQQYGGNTTLLYRHEIVDDAARAHADLYGNKAASIIGGDFKITAAAADSAITLVTDSTGVSTTSTDYADKNLVNDLLDKLANKLYYIGYANGNLKGYVRIAEGLTSSSITAKLRQEDISFYNAAEAKTAGMAEGQGHYSYSLVYPDEQVKDPMATVIDGSKESKDAYRDAGIYKDKTDTYDFTKKPATVNTDGKSDSIIHAGDNDVNVKTNDVLNIIAKDGGTGMKAENGKTVTTTGITNITAKDGTSILADKGTVKLANDTIISAGTGMEAKNGGTITAEGKADITAAGKALHADGDGSTITLKDGSISGKVLAENKGSITTNGAALKGDVTAQTNGTVALTNGSTSTGITADGGTITTNGTEVAGEALAENSGTLSMTGGKAASVTADGGSASTDGTTVDGLISAKDGGTASMKNGSAKGISADKDSTVTATLDKSDAKIDGNVANEGTASVNISNGASWTGDSTGTGTTNANIGSGSTWTGASSNGNTKAVIDGTWTQTGASELASLSGSGTIDKRSDNNGDLNIASYSGNNTFVYNHSIVTDSTRENAEYYGDKNGGNKAVSVSGGNINITEAAKGSTISLMTDRAGLNVDSSFFRDKNLTNDALDKLANKLYYHGTESLTGRVGFGEGLTAPSEWKNITFKTDGQGSYDYTTIVNSLDIQYGSEETAMMKGTKSALLGSAMMWRSNNNDIQRRMGDLRLGQGETGVWARYMGGKNKYDQQNTYLNQDYDIGQAGFDKKVGDWTVGLALDHGDGKSHYIGGKGKEKMNTLAIYGTRVSNDGKYFDVIVKTGQVKNKFDVSNEIGNKLHGDYKAWGNSISLEYGKRFVQDSGFYMDPSVEFTAGRLNGKNFKGTSDLGTLYVHQHGFNSAIGRIGFSIGRQQERSNIYAKFALAHEFGGNFKTDFYADDGGLKSTKVDLSDTWLDMELGGSLSLGKNVYLYGTYTRTFEADMATKWRADVGVRYTF